MLVGVVSWYDMLEILADLLVVMKMFGKIVVGCFVREKKNHKSKGQWEGFWIWFENRLSYTFLLFDHPKS